MSDVFQFQIPVETDGALCPDLVFNLESLLPVKFVLAQESGAGRAGEIRIETVTKTAATAQPSTIANLAVPSGLNAASDGKLVEVAVHFADDPDVPFPFRGRSLRVKVPAKLRTLSLVAGEKVLAGSERGPVWTLSNHGGVKHFRSGLALPKIPTAGNLQDVLNGERFMELLPLLHLIRENSLGRWYEGPPLRAGFIFDDPNLHWPSYGHVNYRQVVEHAARENYHVSFAAIPLDTWFTHEATAELFRGHADRLSLCVHGNDHTKQELAKKYSQPGRIALLRQAIRRIERFECRTGLKVSRVMVPPHGACAEEMLEAIPQCGFEGACISHGSLRRHNQARPWTKTLGYLPAELIAGCPVLPRWSLAGNTTNTILLAAFLNQPMILRGHHQDLKDGIELLDQLARVINSLGNVSWSNMTDLSRANYRWRMDGDTCRVQPLGRKIYFPVPSQVAQLIIETSGNCFGGSWQIVGANGDKLTAHVEEEISLSETFSGTIFMDTASPSPAVAEDPASRPVAAAFLRRLAAEGRDRMLS